MPRPFYGERQTGFLQRVAECNGYPSTNFYLSYSGINEQRQRMMHTDTSLLSARLELRGKWPEVH